MKRCPECQRDYFDDTLLFCLEDGTRLADGPSSVDEMPTEVYFDRGSPDSKATAVFGPESGNIQSGAGLPTATSADKKKLLVAGGAVILVLAAGLLAFYRPWNTSGEKVRDNSMIAIERLTTNGRATSAAISPDGKYVVYAVDEGGKDSLWLRQVATSSNIQTFPAEEDVFYWGLTFTPDSNYVNFIKAEFEKNKAWAFSQMAIIGGAQKDLLTGLEGPVSYSPDGKQFAFIRDEFPTDEQSSLMVANADGTGERIIASRSVPEVFPSRQIGPAWSPDGKTIAIVVADESSLIGKMDVVEISVESGEAKPIATQEWKYIDQIAWLSDKSGLLVLGSDRASSSYSNQIWSFSYPDGNPRRLTTDFSNYRSLSLSGDRSHLVTVQAATIANIWAAGAEIDRPVQIRSGGNNEEGMNGLSLMPDGRVLFVSRAGGSDDIWKMDPDGSSPRQLTEGTGSNFDPVASPDGQYIVFTSVRDSKVNIWRMRPDGSAPAQLTLGDGNHSPSISPDSRWVVYVSDTGSKAHLYKVSIDGGETVRLSENFARRPRISPDGKWIACAWRRDQSSTWRYAVIPFDGGPPAKVFDLTGNKSGFRWAPDSKSLYYLRDTQGGVTNVWSLPFPEGEPRQVTDFKGETIFDFVGSADGKQMVFSRGTITSDVVLLRGF